MIKVGIIGLGEVSQLMHLPILQDLCSQYKITAIADVSSSLVKFIAEKYKIEDTYLSAPDLIRKADIDAIFILSPDQYHGEYVKIALECKKHVFVEKPVTLCLQELDELIALKEQYPNQIVMVGYMRRFSDSFLKAKEILEKEPRKIEYLRFRDIICEGPFFIKQTRPIFYPCDICEAIIKEGNERKTKQLEKAIGQNATNAQKKAYTMLTGLGVHSFSAVRELFGNPKKIHSVTTYNQGEQMIIVMEFENFMAVYELVNNQNIVQFDAAIEIFQGYRKLKIKYETPYVRYLPMTLEVIDSSERETKTIQYGPTYIDPFQTELLEFYNCIESKTQPKTILQDAKKDLELFEEIIKVMGKEGK